MVPLQEREIPLSMAQIVAPRSQSTRPLRGLTILRSPPLVLPGGDGDSRSQWLVDAFPVNTPITSLSHVGEDGVFLDGLNGVWICLH